MTLGRDHARYSLLAVAVASVLTLSACNKAENDTVTTEDTPAATTAGAASGSASADQYQDIEGVE